MPTTINDSSLITKRRQDKAQSQSFLNRIENPQNPTTSYAPRLGIWDQSILNNVKNGAMTYYSKQDGSTIVDKGCPNCIPSITISSTSSNHTDSFGSSGGSLPYLIYIYSGVASKDSQGTDCALPIYNLLNTLNTPENTKYRIYFCGSGNDSTGTPYVNTGDEAQIQSLMQTNGQNKRISITTAALQLVSLYIQPGGGDDYDVAWKDVQPYASLIQTYVASGGSFLGICMGAFLAGGANSSSNPGYALLQPGDTNDFTNDAPSIALQNDGGGDLLVPIHWTLSNKTSVSRTIYFQGGPYFMQNNATSWNTVSTYVGAPSSEQKACVIVPYGNGKVIACGPHPEAPIYWYTASGFTGYTSSAYPTDSNGRPSNSNGNVYPTNANGYPTSDLFFDILSYFGL